MNMSGLCIVLEESDSPAVLREVLKLDQQMEVETLLPPLLHELDTPEKPMPFLGLSNGTSSLTPSMLSSSGEKGLTDPTTSEANQELQSLVVPTRFNSESSEIEFDSMLLSFPSIEPPTPSLTTFLNLLASLSTQPQHQASTTNTSPLSRLKSFKKGIRKLSLSGLGSSVSLAGSTPIQTIDPSPPLGRPDMSPSQPEYHNDSTSLSSNSDNSPLSIFSGLVLRNASWSCPPGYGKTGTPGEVTQTNSSSGFFHASSTGQILLKKSRRRTHSQSQWPGNSSTLPSPIITLSDNLPSSSENLSGVEQSFFSTISRSPLSLGINNIESNRYNQDEEGNALSKLNTAEDLIDYLIYLSEHKKSVEEAFVVAKDRLSGSGWCSQHDIENLNLQRDVSLSQIDTKLLQIEEKLNSDFHVSMLNNINMVTPAKCQNTSRKAEEPKGSLCPSLKVLEKKYLLYALEQQAIMH